MAESTEDAGKDKSKDPLFFPWKRRSRVINDSADSSGQQNSLEHHDLVEKIVQEDTEMTPMSQIQV